MNLPTRRVGHVEHQIALPGGVDPDTVPATLDSGLLPVRLAKARRSQPRHKISGPTTTSSPAGSGQSAGAYAPAVEASDAGASSTQTASAGSPFVDQSTGGAGSGSEL
ncbi:Hsp20/alpha crystallin family protein [Parafrankia sp. EUN1f]|uniref:Hsp20 family protein n=1 Tax=Parafrankia sp. EUN1f TaxID=102897 RepID=UPI000681A503|nr:Hsp20/alpha crystallin family protein [Parafrankia sp. EUN1f]